MKIHRICFRCALAIAICLVLPVVLSTGSRTRAAVRPNSILHVWCVGNPFTGAMPETIVPTDLQQQAEKLGYTIVVQNFRAAGFPSILHEALNDHTEPEFITFDNFGILTGVNTPAGRYQGVLDTDYGVAASLQLVDEKFATLQRRGWVVLLRSAANYDAARALVMQPPQCQIRIGASEDSLAGELKQAMEAANHAAWAYLSCDLPSLTSQSDDERFGRKCFLPAASVGVETVRACGVLGNNSLVFVPLAGTFLAQTSAMPPRRDVSYSHWLAENALGQQTVLAVLRKQNGRWRLLAITSDQMDTNPAVYPTYSNLQRLAKLLTNEGGGTLVPSPAALTTPDGAKVRRLSQTVFENFEWTPSASPDVVAQVAEFLIGDRSGPGEITRLFFLIGNENRLSSGFLLGAGGRWRVWSISRAGNVSLTEPRAYANW